MSGEWQGVLDEIKLSVSELAFATYFANLRLISADGGVLVVEVPNVFIKTQMEGKYNTVVLAALKSMGIKYGTLRFEESKGEKRTVRRGIEVQLTQELEKQANSSARKANFGADSETGLNPKYRFDNYVVGGNNDLAVSAAHAIVDNPGGRYNPYYLYGGPGLGKTHLIQAIGNEMLAKNPKLKILYTTIEDFYSSFVDAMRKKIDFSDKFRKVDVLIVDDFQFIVGKDKSQDEFFHTFNSLHQKNKQIIVSSDRLPTQIATVDERLSSRLMMGVPVDIQMPDFEVRCAILKSKADLMGVEVENDAIEFLANNIKSNIRELEGKFNQLIAMSDLRGMSPGELIKEGYVDDAPYAKSKTVSPKRVIDVVAKYYDLSAKDLLGTSRAAGIKTPRQIAMYLMNEEFGFSTVRIGTEFSKDHTTIMHGVKKIKGDLKLDFGLREQIAALREILYGD